MNRTLWIAMVLALVGFAALDRGNAVSGSESNAPQFNDKGELLHVPDYRDWVWLTSGLDMTYDDNGRRAGPASEVDEPRPFDNVFVKPESYREFLRTGAWPDKTMFVLEIRMSKTKVHPNQSGYVQGDLVGMSASVKDVKRFGDKKWAYFAMMHGGHAHPGMKMDTDACWSCHNRNGAVDNTFVQFYPTLKTVAQEKGTYKTTGPGQ